MVLLEIIVVVLSAISVFLGIKYVYLKANFEMKISEWITREEEKIRKDAIERSARTLSGKTLEKLIPFLDRFPYDPHDMRWMGDPVDFIVFDGSSKKSPKQIIFCEVKSGNSNLNKNQNAIKELVENKKVKWFEFRIEK